MTVVYYETQEDLDDASDRQMELLQDIERKKLEIEEAEISADHARSALREADSYVLDLLEELEELEEG